MRHSRWPTLILLILIGLMLGGIAALAWSQRSLVKDVVGDLISSVDNSGPRPALSEDRGSIPDAATPAMSKNADRLGGAAAPEEAPKSVRTVDAGPPPDGRREAIRSRGVVRAERFRATAPAAASEPAARAAANANAAAPS